ncbi:MAG: hypothetical protein RIB30_09835 [Thalassospira sp.]|uniref:hypothetical protein n=1 Tax=Thalassospira sp. TaxID=1912094 RepID=UPI0032F02793
MIADWFFDRFEDPSVGTPHNGNEGENNFIHGGPYDAREAIEAEFNAVVSTDIIDKAIDFVESDGTFEWAPSPNHPDYIGYDQEPEASRDEDNRFFDVNGGFPRSPDGLPNLGEGTFYSAPWDPKVKISPAEVHSLSPQRQRELIEHWFYYLFEALSDERLNSTDKHRYPFDQRTAYKARDVILNEYIEIADRNVILDVISKVQDSGGAVWGPGPSHPDRGGLVGGDRRALDPAELGLPFGEREPLADHDQIDARLERGGRTSFGTTYERAVRRSILARAADLQALLAKPAPKTTTHGGIGHNQPPSDIELDEEHKEELKEAVETISEQLGREQPDVRKVSRAARTIQSIGKWVAQKLDMTLDTFLKSLATALGTSAAAAITAAGLLGHDTVVRKAMELYQSVIDWLNAVVLPM